MKTIFSRTTMKTSGSKQKLNLPIPRNTTTHVTQPVCTPTNPIDFLTSERRMIDQLSMYSMY